MSTTPARPLRCPVCGALDTLSLAPAVWAHGVLTLDFYLCAACGAETAPLPPSVTAILPPRPGRAPQ